MRSHSVNDECNRITENEPTWNSFKFKLESKQLVIPFDQVSLTARNFRLSSNCEETNVEGRREGEEKKRMTFTVESEGTCFKYLPSEESLILIR